MKGGRRDLERTELPTESGVGQALQERALARADLEDGVLGQAAAKEPDVVHLADGAEATPFIVRRGVVVLVAIRKVTADSHLIHALFP
jgi:hypothetical protein